MMERRRQAKWKYPEWLQDIIYLMCIYSNLEEIFSTNQMQIKIVMSSCETVIMETSLLALQSTLCGPTQELQFQIMSKTIPFFKDVYCHLLYI